MTKIKKVQQKNKKTLEAVRKKNKKVWQTYQNKKKKIKKLKRVSEKEKATRLENLLNIAKAKISDNFRIRREKNYALKSKYKTDIPHVKKIRSDQKFTSVIYKYYMLNKRLTPDQELEIFSYIRKNKTFRGILVIMKIKLKETGMVSYISEYFSYKGFQIPNYQDRNLFDILIEKYSVKPEVRYEGYKLLDKYIRILVNI